MSSSTRDAVGEQVSSTMAPILRPGTAYETRPFTPQTISRHSEREQEQSPCPAGLLGGLNGVCVKS
ncbi:hypothetical protein EYF80_015480 [Liparis tanakae]|uniref:Uncharacterized protein n=1 Tax=Liparis tanakae TaxID=230148 RepID=A0A4Z2I8C1_9TELE|nr:hypothetical protein EYF80_015480 [Liparis tanakae]